MEIVDVQIDEWKRMEEFIKALLILIKCDRIW